MIFQVGDDLQSSGLLYYWLQSHHTMFDGEVGLRLEASLIHLRPTSRQRTQSYGEYD